MNNLTINRHPIITEDMEEIFSKSEGWRQFAGKHIVITGSTGLLASYLIEFFSWLNETWTEAPIVIYALARHQVKMEQRFPHLMSKDWFRPVIQDVCMAFSESDKVDFIIHAASPSSPKYFLSDPVGTIKANAVGTLNMLELARSTGARLLFMSSGAIYGHGESLESIKETDLGVLDPLNIYSCYGEGKRIAETLCSAYWHQYNVPAIIARISHSYGPGMALDDGRVFADFIADALSGRDILLNSDGTSSRPFCYVADTTAAFLVLLLRGEGGEAYNVGMDYEITILDLAKLIARLSPHENIKVKLPQQEKNKSFEFRASGHFNINKIRSLGWSPDTSYEIGFKRTLKYFIN